MPACAVRGSGLVKRFGALTAVNELSLEVALGECFGMLGPNGAGKTTTVEMLEGLTRPDEGEIQILGMDYARSAAAIREQLGVQLQQTELAERLTVQETLQQFRSFYREGRSIEELLDLMALREKRHARIKTLSGGQQQRLALACALAGRPKLLFLDEPTTGLDPQARLKVWEVVERFRAEGGTILLTTHYMEEAARLCDRVGIVDRGRIIALDTPAALIASLGAQQIIELEAVGAPLEPALLETIASVTQVRSRGRTWALSTRDLRATLPDLLASLARAGAQLEALRTHQPTLEDVFVQLTGRELRDG